MQKRSRLGPASNELASSLITTTKESRPISYITWNVLEFKGDSKFEIGERKCPLDIRGGGQRPGCQKFNYHTKCNFLTYNLCQKVLSQWSGFCTDNTITQEHRYTKHYAMA